MKQQELGSILHFIYFGEANISENRISQFLNIARDFQIKQLAVTFVTRSNAEGDSDFEAQHEYIKHSDNLENPVIINQNI